MDHNKDPLLFGPSDDDKPLFIFGMERVRNGEGQEIPEDRTGFLKCDPMFLLV
jgi:hypothetical protein